MVFIGSRSIKFDLNIDSGSCPTFDMDTDPRKPFGF